MHRLTLREIPTPDWAPPHARHVVHLSGNAGTLAQQAFAPLRSTILADFHRRLNDFVNDPDCCYHGPRAAHPGQEVEPFPLQSRIVGTYYIGTETYYDCSDRPNRPSYDFGVFFRLQEAPWAPGQVDCDYLGLEARAYLWLPEERLEVEEGFETSVI